jgi:ribosomal protein L3
MFGQDLLLHPTGAGSAHRSGRGQDQEQAGTPRILVEQHSECFDVVEVRQGCGKLGAYDRWPVKGQEQDKGNDRESRDVTNDQLSHGGYSLPPRTGVVGCG